MLWYCFVSIECYLGRRISLVARYNPNGLTTSIGHLLGVTEIRLRPCTTDAAVQPQAQRIETVPVISCFVLNTGRGVLMSLMTRSQYEVR